MALINDKFEVNSPFPSLSFPKIDLWSFLNASFSQHKYDIALCDPMENQAITFTELQSMVESVAIGLYQLGYKTESPIIICMANCVEYVIAMLAAWKLGGTVAMINPLLTDGEIKKQLMILNARWLVCDGVTVHKCKIASVNTTIQVEMLFFVPPIAVMFINSSLSQQYDLSCVKTIISSAAPLSKEVEQEVKKKLNNRPKMTQALGMTELTCLAIIVPSFPTKIECPHGSVGWPNCNTLVKVVDPSSNMNLGPGKLGEICFKNTYMMKGYYNNPTATKRTIDTEGWLHGGDIGYYDLNGCFFVVDRLKELIKYKGYQVAPAELEALLLNHPDVSDVGVTSILDAQVGELPYAWVVRKRGSKIMENDIHEYVNKNVATFKRLRGGIKFVTCIPKSPSGKILRRQIRESNKLSSKL